jgi:hypothetical protein
MTSIISYYKILIIEIIKLQLKEIFSFQNISKSSEMQKTNETRSVFLVYQEASHQFKI